MPLISPVHLHISQQSSVPYRPCGCRMLHSVCSYADAESIALMWSSFLLPFKLILPSSRNYTLYLGFTSNLKQTVKADSEMSTNVLLISVIKSYSEASVLSLHKNNLVQNVLLCCSVVCVIVVSIHLRMIWGGESIFLSAQK